MRLTTLSFFVTDGFLEDPRLESPFNLLCTIGIKC